MRLGSTVLLTSLMLTGFGLGGCGGSGEAESEPGTSVTEVSVGEPRQVPLEYPCQWLTVTEAAEAMDKAGVDLGTSDVGTVTNAVPVDDGANCWYMPKSGATGRVVVTLFSSEEVAKNWRSRMVDVAASGVQEDDGAHTSSLTRVAGTAALQEAQQTDGSAGCHVTALVSDTAVASADLSVASASDSEALCTVATDVLTTVVERLPEAG